jgi:hypothetical protein
VKLKSFEAKLFRKIKPYSTFHSQFIPFHTTSNGSDIKKKPAKASMMGFSSTYIEVKRACFYCKLKLF